MLSKSIFWLLQRLSQSAGAVTVKPHVHIRFLRRKHPKVWWIFGVFIQTHTAVLSSLTWMLHDLHRQLRLHTEQGAASILWWVLYPTWKETWIFLRITGQLGFATEETGGSRWQCASMSDSFLKYLRHQRTDSVLVLHLCSLYLSVCSPDSKSFW